MANKTKFDYLPLFKAYENGEMSVAEISRKYNINRTSFFNCYKRYKEKIDNRLRVAIGTDEEMDCFLSVLEEYLNEKS